MKNLCAVLLLIVSIHPFLYSQENQLDSLLDAVILGEEELDFLFEEQKNYHFLYLRSAFATNTLYAGREIGVDQFNSRFSATYFNSNGFYGGVSGAWYSQLEPNYSSTSLTLGYSKAFVKLPTVRWRVSTDRFFYTDQEFEPTFTGSITVGATAKHKILGLRADYSLIYGQELSSQLSASTYLRLNLLKFGAGNKLQFRPAVTFFVASETVETETSSGGPRFPGIPTYTSQDVTGLLNTQLSVPLTLYLKNWDLQVDYRYNLPHSLDSQYSYPGIGQLNISVGYLLNTVR